MPLELLLPLVVVGIAGIALLLHLTGHSRPFRLDDAATAAREWSRHFPQERPQAVHLAPGAVLVETEFGVGLLRPFGADTIAHRIAAMERSSTGLRIGFADWAAPDITLAVPPAIAADWLNRWSRHD